MMKRYRFMLSLAMAGFLAAACEDEQIVNMTPSRPAEIGEEIIFGARAGFENANPDTRTVYGDTYEVNGVKYDRIDWVDGSDKIQIMSPQATTPGMSGSDAHTAHYVVKDASEADDNDNTTVDKVDEAYLDKITETDPALQWGVGESLDINSDGDYDDEGEYEGLHTFYAMYPSVRMFFNEDGTTSLPFEQVSNITMDETKISGYIHTEQYASEITYDENTKTYTAAPDMRYAYMVAKSMATRKDGSVNLTFFPLVTALEIEMKLPTKEELGTEGDVKSVTIANVNVNGKDIAGTFEATYPQDWNGGEAFPAGNITSGGIQANQVFISTAGVGNYALTLEPGQKFVFTVFLKPTGDLTNLKAGIALDLVGRDNRYKSLQDVTITARKKNIITGLKLPINIEKKGIEYEDWMAQVPDNTLIQGISLPGTGNSFSYGMPTNTTNRAYYLSQKLTFEQQWNAGIRVFEIASDRENNTNGTGFSSLNVTCGKNSVKRINANGSISNNNLTIDNVVDSLIQKLNDNPYETAMLIMTYQPKGSSPARRGPQYIAQLNTYFNSKKVGSGNNAQSIDNKLVLYSPNLQLGSYKEKENPDGTTSPDFESGSYYVEDGKEKLGARGRLMVVVRPTSKDEKDYTAASGGSTETTGQNVYTAIEGQMTGITKNKILVLHGCGTGKDKWGARGYTINTIGEGEEISSRLNAPDISNSASRYIEQFMTNRNNPIFTTNSDGEYTTTSPKITLSNTNFTISRAEKDKMPEDTDPNRLKFGYSTNNSTITCWYQEWARVISKPIYQSAVFVWEAVQYSQAIQWFESYEEKLSNAKTTFDMAVSGSYAPKGYVFINSLCGYLASETPQESVIPSTKNVYGGAYGDIGALATELNKDFYNHVIATINAGGMIAPTGVVLMDFVSNQESDGGAYWLPQLIIRNNEFKVGVDNPNDDDDDDDDDDDPPVDNPDEEDW